MQTDLPLHGGCLCKRVRYEVRALPLTLSMCHCGMCKHRSGSAFAISMAVPSDAFAITDGVTITRELPTGSGSINEQHFCEQCLVRTHFEPRAFAGVTLVPSGTLDDARWVQPVAQLWTSEALPWAYREGILSFEANATDPAALVRAFRAT